jgi:tetratricopeptide (TPR) repeat protein
MRNLITLFLIALSCIAWSQEDFEATFQAANEAYASGDYAAAIAGYESILEDRMHFESEYNLGNAYYKSRDWGSAILHYERATRLSPSNSDVRTNLVLANAQIKDRIESLPSNGILDLWDRIVAPGRFKL